MGGGKKKRGAGSSFIEKGAGERGKESAARLQENFRERHKKKAVI